MSISRIYIPQERKKAHPVIIGFPGFVHSYEENRMDNIFKELQRQGVAGIRTSYSEIGWLEGGKKIICPVHIKTLERDVSRTLQYLERESHLNHFDNKRIGILASSIGAGIFGQCFAKHFYTGIKSYVSISPVPGWNQYATEEQRRLILESKKELDISSKREREEGITRIIPYNSISELKRLDSMKALEKIKFRRMLPKTLTLRGEKDKLASAEAMRRHHELMGGELDDFLEFPAEHEIPEYLSNNKIIDFILENT